MMSDLAFEQALARFNDEFRDAEEFGNDWMPDDGWYVVILTGLKKGVSARKDTGEPLLWWRLVGQIDDEANEKIHGKEFIVGMYSSSLFGLLKSQARVLNHGLAVKSQQEADVVLSDAVGKVIKVEIVTTTSKKNDREYTNCYIREVINVEDAFPQNDENNEVDG